MLAHGPGRPESLSGAAPTSFASDKAATGGCIADCSNTFPAQGWGDSLSSAFIRKRYFERHGNSRRLKRAQRLLNSMQRTSHRILLSPPLALPPPAPHRWTDKLLQEDIVFRNRLERAHLHFPWCRGGDWQRERNPPNPVLPALPPPPLPLAASATTPTATPPQTQQAPGTRLAPKTQLRHGGKERPAWRGAWHPAAMPQPPNGRGSRALRPKGHLGAASPGTSGPQASATSFSSWKGSCPSQALLLPSGPFSTPPPPAPSLSNRFRGREGRVLQAFAKGPPGRGNGRCKASVGGG